MIRRTKQDARLQAPPVGTLRRRPVFGFSEAPQTEVLELLGGAAPASKVMPKALIAPHAGYVYSGRVAGAAFAKLGARAQTITRVVLIGPAHYAHVAGIAAPQRRCLRNSSWSRACGHRNVQPNRPFRICHPNRRPHEPEHALEVELPFLQTVLSSFQLVSLVVGDAAPQEVAHLLRQLWDGPETLIVVSSDCPIITATRPHGV